MIFDAAALSLRNLFAPKRAMSSGRRSVSHSSF